MINDMKAFLTIDEEQVLVGEIRAAEATTRGEIRVFITGRRLIFCPERHARRVFRRLRMDSTLERNGSLIVVYPGRRRFVVLGDVGFAGRVSGEFWEEIAAGMGTHLRNGRPLEALRGGIRMLGRTMAELWPAGAENPDELDNSILSG